MPIVITSSNIEVSSKVGDSSSSATELLVSKQNDAATVAFRIKHRIMNVRGKFIREILISSHVLTLDRWIDRINPKQNDHNLLPTNIRVELVWTEPDSQLPLVNFCNKDELSRVTLHNRSKYRSTSLGRSLISKGSFCDNSDICMTLLSTNNVRRNAYQNERTRIPYTTADAFFQLTPMCR